MNQSVLKALGLLNYFTGDTPSLTLKEIAQQAGIPKPTAYRLLSALEAGGFLSKVKVTEHDSTYQLGLKLLELGQIVTDQLEVRTAALPYMQQLAAEVNEVVHLVIHSQDEAAYIEKVDSFRALQLNTRIGKRSPLYLGSGPKMLLAHMSRYQQEVILDKAYAEGEHRVASYEHLLQELAEIYETGYASSIGEQDADTTGITYPICDYSDDVIAALAVSGLSRYFTGDNLTKLQQKTRETAETISRKLGYRRPDF
ncbi:IclR family transcriptional regulator [Barrientosiimonas marina]|uniref:IclR family transcriptional regulator n=1 Tax=Lentibacillus kimchii TaxID=1542911 RepID=A0ABW2UTM2_9BACI